jgi:hypothetical protein
VQPRIQLLPKHVMPVSLNKVLQQIESIIPLTLNVKKEKSIHSLSLMISIANMSFCSLSFLFLILFTISVACITKSVSQ